MLGQKCQASLKALQVEIGCMDNPLEESFTSLGALATSCWWKAVWERLNVFCFRALMDYPILQFSWEHDCTLVTLFQRAQVPKPHLRILNRCRLFFQAIFLSDLTLTGGKYLEQWVLN